jgi:hypothetical protein
MATVAVTTSPVQLDDGTAYELQVTNTGTVDVYVARGRQISKVRPGAQVKVQPEGSSVTASVLGAAGQVTTAVTSASNPETVSIDGGTP